MANSEPRKVKLSFIEDFLLSGTAAVTSKTIAAPIERVKMVIQNQDEMLKRGTLDKPFKGIVDCFRWISVNEGVGAFWRSNFTNCIRYFPTQALNFAFKGQIKPFFKPSKADSKIINLSKNVLAGGLAGGGSLAFVYSLDYARTRLANDLKATKGEKAGKREFNGIIDVYRKTLATDGLAGLYRGFVISFVGIFIYRGFYFGLYDTIVGPLGNDVNFSVKFVVGYAVTVIAGVLSYPIDTIRRRMMMTSGGDKSLMYKSSMDCAVQIMKAEGFSSFFKGAGANILRGVAGAGVLSGFDEFKKNYIKYTYGENCYA